MSDIQKQYALWREFLAVWLASRLATMALNDYTKTGSKDNFTTDSPQFNAKLN